MKKRSSYSRLQADVRKLKTPLIEVWENQYQDKEYTINLDFPEFTCLCPKTGLPDFAVIRVRYSPDKQCLELKSLKMYLIFYRNIGIFHEHTVNKILEDLVRTCKPRWLMVSAEFNVRGGIKTTVIAQYPTYTS
ncbi:MAG: preQ(1) synthase [Candidatus Omnitrophota bacterium]|nr:preQ(1) synthase [Candidatus Omnitrophota bacterium]